MPNRLTPVYSENHYNKNGNIKSIKMLLKATPTTATALELIEDISMANIDLQVVIMGQLQQIVN